MGRDKHENEDLIKHGCANDIWFHVDKLSSAHVYLRLPDSMTIDSIPESILSDCCQLVKANSIEGNKQNNIQIVYTPWSNLHKTNGMESGQVGFKKMNKVKRSFVEKRENAIVNRLNKTRVEKQVDLLQEKVAHQKELLRQEKERERIKKEEDIKKAKENKPQRMEYEFGEMTDTVEDEDDFM